MQKWPSYSATPCKRNCCICRSILSCSAWVPEIDGSSCQTPTAGGRGSPGGWVRGTEQSPAAGSRAPTSSSYSILWKIAVNSVQPLKGGNEHFLVSVWLQTRNIPSEICLFECSWDWVFRIVIETPDFSELLGTSVPYFS